MDEYRINGLTIKENLLQKMEIKSLPNRCIRE